MKKIWLLTTLLVGGLLLTGCNKLNSEIDEIRALELAKTKEWRIELCNNKILAEVDSWATNFVWEEVIYSEWDEDSRHSDNFIYFSWSNWEDKVYGCGLGQHWKFINLFPIDQEFLNSEEYQQLEQLREMLTEEDIAEYTWIFHNNYVDDNNQYLWDISISWDSHWKLKVSKLDTWYIYKYTFDAWWDMYDIFYQTISVTFTSPTYINWKTDLLTWYSEWDKVPYLYSELIKLFAFNWWVQIWDGDTRPTFIIRCFSDPLSDPRFREWWVPANESGIAYLTTISNKPIEIPFINHSSASHFVYWYSTPYLWDFLDQCVFELSHTDKNDIELPFKLSWGFWDSASIIWWNNKEETSYCKQKDINIQLNNWMLCYIESDNDTNVIDVKLWDISDIK